LLRLVQYGAVSISAYRTSETSMAIAGAAGRNEVPVLRLFARTLIEP